jgi:hypothetical protein
MVALDHHWARFPYLSLWRPVKIQNYKLINTIWFSLMFVLCMLDVVKRPTIRTDCTTPLFHILAPTCFGSSLPSSGSFLDPSKLLEIQIGWVVYLLCFPAGKHNRWDHNNPAHRPRNHTLFDTPPIRFVFQVTQKDLRSSLMMAGYCQNM